MKLFKNPYIIWLFILTVFVGCKDDDDMFPQLGSDPKNITELISERSNLSSLRSALAQVGLDSTLRVTTTYTVFAPDNSAFSGVDVSGLSETELENVLLNHVLSTVTADFASTMSTGYLTTLATGPDGNNLSFYTNTEGELRFNGMASLVDNEYDIGATNGVLHTVDGVLLPPTVVDHAAANPEYTTFAQAIEASGLSDMLNGDSVYTVFAPNNSAFESFLADVNGAFGWASLQDIPQDVLQQVVLYHVIADDNLLSDDFDGSELTSVQGGAYIVGDGIIDDATYTNAAISLTNVQGINGVVHGVDKVLLPDAVFQMVLSATLNMVERCDDKGFTDFLQAVSMVNLTTSLSQDDLTAFVPNNAAFTALFATSETFSGLSDFDTTDELAVLADLVNYHLYSGQLMLSGLTNGGTVTTLYGDTFTVDLTGEQPRLKPSFEEAIPSAIINGNIGATNGIIHEINRVMIPAALVSALGIPTASGGVCPVGDTDLVFFDWDANGPWWGNINAENDPSHSLDGSSYGRANFQTGTTGWVDMFWRNGSTMNGQNIVGSNLNDYSLKFDIKTIDPLTQGRFRIRFHDGDGVDAFYDWAPWMDSGEPFETDGWETIEIPLAVLGVPDFSLIDQEFGMAFDGADVFLNFAIDNVRFDTPGGCSGPDPVDDPALVFFDWDANGPWWGNVNAENDPSHSLDGSSYGRANFQTGTTGWVDMFWRNGSTMNGQNVVANNINDYSLKFDIKTIDPLTQGRFRIRFHDGDGVDAFYDWAPWMDSGEPFETDGWQTITIPCAVLGVPDFSLIDQEFGMAFDGADVFLNFAIDNVRFEAN